MKEENVRGDFLSLCMAGARGTTMARRGERLACTTAALLAGTATHAGMVLCGMQWHVEARCNACHSVPVVHSLTGVVAPT